MPRVAWGLCVLALVLGAGWWLLREGDAPRAPALIPEAEPGADAEATLRTRELADAAEEPEDEAPNPFAGVSDPRALLPHLANLSQWRDAVARMTQLVGRDPQRIRELLRALHPDAEGAAALRRYFPHGAVSKVLQAAGEPAIDVLIAELDDANAAYRGHVAAFLGEFGERAARAVPRLVRQLDEVPEDPPSEEAARVVLALGAIGPASGRVLPDLYEWLEEGVTEEVEVAAAHAFIRIGGPTEETFRRCKALLREVNWPKQRGAALTELGHLRERARPMIPYLLKIMEEGDLDERSGYWTLGTMGTPDPALLANLAAKLRAATEMDAAMALYGVALARLGGEGLDLLFELAKERGPRALASLPHAFGPTQFGEGPPYTRLVRAMEPAFAAEDGEIRQAAFDAFTYLNQPRIPAPVLLPVILRGLRDETLAIRNVAAGMGYALERVPASLTDALLARVRDENEDVELVLRCADVLSTKKRLTTDEYFQVLMQLRERYPARAEVLADLHPFAKTKTEAVLRVWAGAVASKIANWWLFAGALRDLPDEALAPYPEALKVAEKMRSLKR